MNVANNTTTWLPPGRLFSLWDMTQCSPIEFLKLLDRLKSLRLKLSGADGCINDHQAQQFLWIIGALEKHATQFHLKHTLAHIELLNNTSPSNLAEQVKREVVATHLASLSGHLITDLRKQVCTFVERPDFFDRDELFGPAVAIKYPRAAADIRDAGTCFATGLYNSAVFHLMRAVEHALRHMAKRLKVKADSPNWGAIILVIQKEIKRQDDSQNQPPWWKRNRAMFHEAATHFRHFKSVRNNANHAGDDSYEPDEVETIFRHTREFMQYLAPSPKRRDGLNVARIILGKQK